MKRFLFHLVAVSLVALVFSGCMSQRMAKYENSLKNFSTYDEVAQNLTIEDDKFKKVLEVGSPLYTKRLGKNIFRHIRSTLILKHDQQSNENLSYLQVAISYSSANWHFYEEVFDSDGNKLTTSLVRRDVGACSSLTHDCSYLEIMNVYFDKEYLSKHLETGVNLKFYGKSGEQTLKIPSIYLKAPYDKFYSLL